MKDLEFKNVSRSCPICFNECCPMKDDCLRYIAGRMAPADTEVHLCVLPHVLKDGQCSMFQKNQKVRVAYGFERSFEFVRRRDYTPMRKALVSYLGCNRSYYWYLRGEKPLMPAQQAWIENLFRQHGYEGNVVYDRTDDVYVLESVPY